jgi:site-specific DNA-methyltransferase (adenine-specific)
MLEKLVKECYRILANNSHMYLFFGIQHYADVLRMVEEAGFGVNPMPCIWYKTGGQGVGAGAKVYSNNWEPFFFLRKGGRDLSKAGYSNVFVEPRVPPQKKIHPAEKPTSLLRKLIEMSTNPGETVLDPFAGSASTLIAAFECNRVPMGFEMDGNHYNAAALRLAEVLKEKEK